MQARRPRLGYGFTALSLAGLLVQIPLAAFHVSHRVAYVVLGVTVGLVAVATALLWPLVREHLPIKWVGFSGEPPSLPTTSDAALAPTPLAAGLLAAGLDPSDDRTRSGRQTEILRDDLVFLTDELVAARNTILAAYNDGPYWKQDIQVNVWRAIKTKHMGVKGFHRPRSDVRDAYEAIAQAEDLRRMHEVDPDAGAVMHESDRAELRSLLDRVLEGEQAIVSFLDGLDMPEWNK